MLHTCTAFLPQRQFKSLFSLTESHSYIGRRLIGKQAEQQAVRHDVQPCIMSYLPH